jgi:hypothetical protein
MKPGISAFSFVSLAFLLALVGFSVPGYAIAPLASSVPTQAPIGTPTIGTGIAQPLASSVPTQAPIAER